MTRDRSGVRPDPLPLAVVELTGGDGCSGLTVTESAEALGRSIGRGSGSGTSDTKIRGEEVRAEAQTVDSDGRTDRESFRDVNVEVGRQAGSFA